MQHTTKMVMVPEDAYSGLISQQQQLMPPVAMQLSNLDSELKSILTNPSLNVDQKYDQYYKTFNRYGSLQGRQLPSREATPLLPPPKFVEKGTNTGAMPISGNALLDSLPKLSRRRGKILLDHMQQKKDIKWTDTGELLVEGYPVPGSNITDLVHFFTRNRPTVKPPAGAQELAEQLQDTNVPAEAVAPESFNQVGTLNYDLGTLFSPHVKAVSPLRRPSKAVQVKKGKTSREKKLEQIRRPPTTRSRLTPKRYADIKWRDY